MGRQKKSVPAGVQISTGPQIYRKVGVGAHHLLCSPHIQKFEEGKKNFHFLAREGNLLNCMS